MKMKILILLVLFAGTLYAYDFRCLSRNGWAPGYGRYSYEGEWVDYFGVRAKAGEYVLFQYPGHGKRYWFPAYNCVKL